MKGVKMKAFYCSEFLDENYHSKKYPALFIPFEIP